MTTYVATLPNGKTATRNSKAAYTHAVLCTDSAEITLARAERNVAAIEARLAAGFRSREDAERGQTFYMDPAAERAKTEEALTAARTYLADLKADPRPSYGIARWSSSATLAAKATTDRSLGANIAGRTLTVIEVTAR